ncbi:WSCD family member AGAP003962-like [Strongylocentrotus purpuratus]|uniref:Sulfotransferase n=1 Tax=Strongylocentrotus purpuratus TaxID=7668 RepID=A0A7M7N5B2_STRPU|nr:WSCD family member AGAP003962-like [Strongylocentrotus purpuratus]
MVNSGTVASYHCAWPEGIHLAQANTLPSIALLSYPGSGNTWVRYLIESATGIYTGSIHTDNDLFRSAWNQFVRREISKWSEKLDEAVSFFNITLIIHYEDLKSDLATHLRTILNFMTADTNLTALDASEERFRCTVDHSTGSFKRNKTYMTFDPFTNELRALIDGKIRYVLNRLREMCYPLPPYAINYPPLTTSQATSSK